MPSQQLSNVTNQTAPPIAPIDPTPIIQSESPTVAVILAIAILISILVSGITGLALVLVSTRSCR